VTVANLVHRISVKVEYPPATPVSQIRTAGAVDDIQARSRKRLVHEHGCIPVENRFRMRINVTIDELSSW
jgi:hypothetical protein